MINLLSESSIAHAKNMEYCIIGAGAAGISLCVALASMGKRTLLLDSGGFDESDTDDDAYRGDASKGHPNTTEYRRQRLGGTTHLWGGRCVPFDPQDFRERDHVPNSGWPISERELQPYIEKAQQYCDAGDYDYSVDSLRDNTPMFEGLSKLGTDIEERIERYSLPTDFGVKFRDKLERDPNIQVLLKARCIQLMLNEDGSKVKAIKITNDISHFTLENMVFILCSGGIETTRLLLRAQNECDNWKKLIALGRYYACHFDIIFGELSFTTQRPKFRFQKTKDGVYARRKLQFSEKFQNKNRLLNSTFRLHFPAYSDPSHRSGVLSLIYLAKSILPGEHQAILNHGQSNDKNQISIGPHVRNVVLDGVSIINFAFTWLFKIKLAKRKLPYTLETNSRGTYPLELNSEQIPHKDNRIVLSQKRDKNGVPRIKIHWQLQREDIDSAINSFEALKDMLAQLENVELKYDAEKLKAAIENAPAIGGHHLGTTRMGEDVETSVVNSNCQVHGVENLYIASSSIFTTSGHANPTLLIVAFALRLADYFGNKPS